MEAYKARVEALEAQIKVCMVTEANGGIVELSTIPKGNTPRPPTFHGVKGAREIDNFLRELEAYFGAMGIKDDTQKVAMPPFS